MLAVWVVLVFCPTGEVRAQEPWYVAYENGVKAVREGQWELAETKLKAALRDGPSQGRNVKAYGLRFIDFVPSYYLGVVYFNQQKYEASLDELERAGSLGLVTERDSEYAQMQELLDRLKALLAPVETPPSTPPEKQELPPTPTTDDEQQATALLSYARTLLEQEDVEGARKALESARAKDPANPSIEVLAQRISGLELERLIAQERQAANEKEQRTQTEIESSDELAERAELERLRLQAAIDQGRAEARWEDVIKSGMSAFYTGSYQTAIEILEPLTGERRSAPVLFYLACSRAALALWESDEKREALLSRARADFDESRRLDPRFSFDQRFISPRILSVLTESSR
jgi:tetratricopeptide (TPR) repeat protein